MPRITESTVDGNDVKFVNILGKVGPYQSNQTDDVRVVQELMRMFLGKTHKQTGRFPLPSASGIFDVTTGFWIYRLQDIYREDGYSIDGVVYPADAAFRGPDTPWMIYKMNRAAISRNPIEYAQFYVRWATAE